MNNEAATAKDSAYRLVSLAPDVCLTPSKPPQGVPVPYPITHNMGKSRQCSPNVFFKGKPAYLHDESYVDRVMGDEPGMGKGVVSGTNTKISRSQQHSNNVFVNGKPLVRTGDTAWMNRSEPGNAKGKSKRGKPGTERPLVGAEGLDAMAPGGPNSGGQEADDKRKRWECRQGQIAAAKEHINDMPDGTEKDQLQAATERFERNNVAMEHARLSQAVYDEDNYPVNQDGEYDTSVPLPAPAGWNNISNDRERLAQYGLKPEDLYDPPSNFGAQVYEPAPAAFGDDLKPTIAFKGTEMTNMEDWKNNLAQGMNFHSDYYERAVSIGTKLERSGASVHITGHSLGGGTASGASQASGLPATTFNAAGLHRETVERYGGTLHQTDIQAYRIKGEILTGIQEPGWGGTALAAGAGFAIGGIKGAAIGALARVGLAALMPDAVGTPHELEGKGKYPIALHGMDQVVNGIEAQKSEDQQIIADATGKTCP